MKIIKFLTLLTIVSYFFSSFIFIFSLTGLLFCLMKKYSINDKFIKIIKNFNFNNIDIDVDFLYFDFIFLLFIITIYNIFPNNTTSSILILTFIATFISIIIIFFSCCINIIKNNDNKKIISFISYVILDISILVSMFYVYFFNIKYKSTYFGYLFLLIIIPIIVTYKEYNNLIKTKGNNFKMLNDIKSKIYDFISNIVDVKITKNDNNISEEIEDLFYNSSSWEIKTNSDGQKYAVFYGNEDNTEIKNYKIYLNKNKNLCVNLNISVKEIMMYFYNIFKNNNYSFVFNCGVGVNEDNITVNNQKYEISIYSFLFNIVKHGEFLTYKIFALFEDDNYNGIYFIIKTNKEIIFNILKNNCKYYENRFEYIHFNNPIKEITNNTDCKEDKGIVSINDGNLSFSFPFDWDIEEIKKFLMN